VGVAEPADQEPSLFARALLLMVRVYQLVLSPVLGGQCRFYPSCSHYTADCLRLHGGFKGSYLGLRRLLRCHPFNPGGYDPVPGSRELGPKPDAPG
jgi:putative membrane protein insertion efficiency factor